MRDLCWMSYVCVLMCIRNQNALSTIDSPIIAIENQLILLAEDDQLFVPRIGIAVFGTCSPMLSMHLRLPWYTPSPVNLRYKVASSAVSQSLRSMVPDLAS
eukprot:scaffold3541_cov116-Cylindrotheca_fusiformis.AAC.3